MSHFTDYNQDKQEQIVLNMRADYDCKQPVEAWIEAARQINPVIGSASYIPNEPEIRVIAKQAGEEWQ